MVKVSQAVGIQADLYIRLQILDPGRYGDDLGKSQGGLSVSTEHHFRALLPAFCLQCGHHLVGRWVTVQFQIVSLDDRVGTSLAIGTGAGAASGYVEVNGVTDGVSDLCTGKINRKSEEIHGVPGGHPGHIVHGESFDGSDLFGHQVNVGRFVALTPHGVGCEVRAVCLDHHTF